MVRLCFLVALAFGFFQISGAWAQTSASQGEFKAALAEGLIGQLPLSEWRRYSLYLEGMLAGILLPLIINIWYSLSYKRDTVSLIYAVWVLVGLMQIVTMPILDGQRLFEFFLQIDMPFIGSMSGQEILTRLFTFLQNVLFIQFGRSFLGTRENFPRLHLISSIAMGLEFFRLICSVALPNQEINEWLWRLCVGIGVLSYPGFPICTWIRYRQGVRSAQFACLSSSIYSLCWVALNLEMAGQSIFTVWPFSHIDPFLKSKEFIQAFSICLPAIITNFSIQSRTRGIERKLRQTMQIQKEAAENQNLILESTVLERTHELNQQRHSFEVLSHQLAKYLPPQIHEALMAGDYDTRVSTKRKQITVFFSDIKNFTTTTESLQPEALTEYLNAYFSEMTQIALEHGATIDKYIGDAMMVFFGDPVSRGVREDARACVRMALKMQERMQVLGKRWQAQGFASPFMIRIGINTGYCNVGNFGSEQRLSYTIIGREVNLAQRLESQADPGGILISYETLVHVQDLVKVEERPAIQLKGIAHGVKAFAVTGQLNAESREVLSLHDSNGVSIDLYPGQLGSESRLELANALRQIAARLDSN